MSSYPLEFFLAVVFRPIVSIPLVLVVFGALILGARAAVPAGGWWRASLALAVPEGILALEIVLSTLRNPISLTSCQAGIYGPPVILALVVADLIGVAFVLRAVGQRPERTRSTRRFYLLRFALHLLAFLIVVRAGALCTV